MSSREDFLARIARALGHQPGESVNAPPREIQLPELGAVMPPIPPGGLIAKFEEELEKVNGHAHRVASPTALAETLQTILKSYQTKKIVLSRNPFLAQLGIPQKVQELGISTAAWPAGGEVPPDPASGQRFREEAFAAEVGITGADWVLAESGTLVLTSLTEGAQIASLAPPVHVALYRSSQVVASLEGVLERLPIARGSGPASPGRSIVFVTGVSRTADIEQILIRGVHGPRELHAILVEDSAVG